MLNASDVLGALGEEMVTMTTGETGAPSTWEVVAVPGAEIPVPELRDELIGADAYGDSGVPQSIRSVYLKAGG